MRKIKEMSESVNERTTEVESWNPDAAARNEAKKRHSHIVGGDPELLTFEDETKPSHPGGGFIGRNNVRDRI